MYSPQPLAGVGAGFTPAHLTHEFKSLKGPNGEKVFEAYVQHLTPGAFRVFWYYGPEKGQITIAAIPPIYKLP